MGDLERYTGIFLKCRSKSNKKRLSVPQVENRTGDFLSKEDEAPTKPEFSVYNIFTEASVRLTAV
jgi:hypothetical protein